MTISSDRVPELSILICSLHSREASLTSLMRTLDSQARNEVEVLVETDGGERSIGEKRNTLLGRAQGRYVCFIDDDDRVAEDYVTSILAAISDSPDCVGFLVSVTENGNPRGRAIHSLRFERYGQRPIEKRSRFGSCLMEYERTPNHLNPVRRELALQVRFPKQNWREDTDYAERLRPLLKTEVFIDKVLYHYLYVSKK